MNAASKRLALTLLSGSLLYVFSGGSMSVTAQEADPLTKADFELLHAAVQPDQGETWRQIPWKISLLEGQQQAVEEHKPIFLWAMDGHPLGCT